MQDLYFKNEKTRTIFGLVELNGKQQIDFLGIDYSHYSNKKIAEIWYTETKEKIANSNHSKLDVALANLEKLYKGMK